MPTQYILYFYIQKHIHITKMADGLRKAFANCKKEGRSALVTYVTAGYPTADATVDIM